MPRSREELLPMLGLGAALVLGGCVDMFTGSPPDAVAWSGTTTAGNTEFPGCGAFQFELGQYRPGTFMWDTVSGRAWPTQVPDTQTGRWAGAYRQWWLEGYVTEAEFVQFETKLQQPIYFGARPYAVWRGSIDGDRMVLTESGSPCDREVVLLRG
jgi:hypothetical protein